MQLSVALKKIQQSPELTGLFVVVLQGYDTPSSFLSSFYAQLKNHNDLTFLDLATSSLNDCKAHLEMSFLGQRRCYVLRNLSTLDAALTKKWNEYLQKYQGPHTLIFFESQGKTPRGSKVPKPKKSLWKDSEIQLVIELGPFVDIPSYTELFTFFYSVSVDKVFIRTLFSQQQRLLLDDACRMMCYQTVVGRNGSQFFEQWYTKLVLSEVSLFSLSQYFLGRNTKLFLKQWKACKDDFPPEFWIAYWSEQLWQATQYISKAKAYGIAEAKIGQFRLPFTFLNNDWQRHSLQSLSKAHDALYSLDHALKNSGGAYALELWYHKFLQVR